MAEEKAEVHGRVAQMGSLVIHQREALGVGQDILGTVIAVAEGFPPGQHLVDQRLHSVGHLGPAFLDTAIERLDPKLHEDGMVLKPFDEAAVSGGFLVDQAEARYGARNACGQMPDR